MARRGKPPAAAPVESVEGQRLDKWLWYARVYKSRGLAQRMIADGRVRIDTVRAEAAHKTVRPGHVLTITLERDIRVLEVLLPGERRGPASEAQLLYKDLSPPKPKRSDHVDPRRVAAPKPEKRPSRRDRAALEGLKRSGGIEE
ncbi:MAG: RNA-binding S4 domain-containing protein [Pseudomonadota bacterium]